MPVSHNATLRVAIDDFLGNQITGTRIVWSTSNPSVLQVEETPPTLGTLEDSLVAQLQATVTATARGRATVSVVVEGGPLQETELSQQITVTENWTAISAGSSHTCAINMDEEAFCWGAGGSGELGNGSTTDSPIPRQVSDATGTGLRFRSISAGTDNTCGDVLGGVLHCWGSGDLGQLGTGTTTGSVIPTPVSIGFTFRQFAAGQTTCGITDGFTALCWGDNRSGQIGAPFELFNQLDECFPGVPNSCSLLPREVKQLFSPLTFVSVDVSHPRTDLLGHTCGLDDESKALCWGAGLVTPFTLDPVYLLGVDGILQSDTAIAVAGARRFAELSVGGTHTCARESAGTVYCWGNNDFGQLGTGSTSSSATPRPVAKGLAFTSISAGGGHTCGTTLDGVYCWGNNQHGQLGLASSGQCDSPFEGVAACELTPEPVPGGARFGSVKAGATHTCALRGEDGAAFCWGDGGDGRLGNNSEQSSSSPVRVLDPPPDRSGESS